MVRVSHLRGSVSLFTFVAFSSSPWETFVLFVECQETLCAFHFLFYLLIGWLIVTFFVGFPPLKTVHCGEYDFSWLF
jgi:hypothetical protein